MNEVNSIEWHKECSKNALKYTMKELEYAEEALKEKKKKHAEALFRKYQIECAIKEKKEKFLEDRYKKKHREDFIRQQLSDYETKDSQSKSLDNWNKGKLSEYKQRKTFNYKEL